MSAIDHHSMNVSPNCTNSTIATVACPCAAVVAAEVGLQTDRRLEHVAILSLLIFYQSLRCFANISGIQPTFSLSEIPCASG